MRKMFALIGLLILSNNAMSQDENAAYLEGLNDGYAMGYMAVKGQTMPDMESQYNKGVDIINSWMAAAGYTEGFWGYLQKSNHTLPNIFADPDGIWRQV